MKKIYLDNAATTPVAAEVAQEIAELMQSCFGNPSSIHGHGREAKAILEKARRKVAELTGTQPSRIFFTSGGTEADNMAIRQTIAQMGISHVISSPIEHHAVTHTIEELATEGKVSATWLKPDRLGRHSLEDLETALQKNPGCLVSLMHANNEIGTTIDLQAVGQLCRKYGALFHSDTVQTMGHFELNFDALPVDLATCSAHKFHGPKGIGFLYVNLDRVKISALITGGAQERNLRAGTENLYGIAALAKALELATDGMHEHRQHIYALKMKMAQGLKRLFPDCEFNGSMEESDLFTVLNVSLPPTPDAEMFLMKLDIHGISASGGSACSSGSQKGSHVLSNIGAPEGRPAIRFSFSRYNQIEDVDYALEVLQKIWKPLVQNA